MIIEIIIYLFLFYVLHNAYSKYKKLNNNQLSGPFPIPILGNIYQLSDLPHLDLTRMSSKYGKIFRIYLADLYTVIVCDPIIVREIFVEKFDNFIDRPKIPSVKHGTFFHGTVSSMNEDWRNNREIVGKAMRKTNLKHIYELLDDQVDLLIEKMKLIESSGEQFDPRYYLTKFTMSAMFKYIFNEDVSNDEDINNGQLAKLMKPMQKVFKDFGTGSLFDVLEIARPMYFLYLEWFTTHYYEVINFGKMKIFEHLKTYNPEVQRDLMDLLIKEYGTDTDDQILSISSTVSDFFLAGVDTSSTTLELVVLMLINYPEYQEKAYNEIKSALNGRDKVILSDRQSTPFIVSLFKETLRYKPISPFGLPRSTTNDIFLNGGQFIPKNAQILINYHALSRNEEYYDNPNEFNPNRFLNSDSNIAFMPFSIGPRNCVGSNFAQDEIYIALSNMILNFKFKSIDGKQVDESQTYGLTLKPNPFKLILEKRK
ncbi:hypothetical protein RB653_010520 [Dictyostelium firmibasis]|uniref:Cytochrome P450 n=1 Tax=Dictyostelium firmibasis TaxID=79012 RepID=A0AAN7TTV8_9MYCE